jgi:precorrin-4/cobalt-precorrin-4 C11-methyltransferase
LNIANRRHNVDENEHAVFLSGNGPLVEVLQEAYGRSAPCAVVYRASHPDETIVYTTLDALAGEVERAGIRRQAVIIVGRVLDVSLANLRHKSKLYDAGFAHGYRSGDDKSG